jgi:hypothetical protein
MLAEQGINLSRQGRFQFLELGFEAAQFFDIMIRENQHGRVQQSGLGQPAFLCRSDGVLEMPSTFATFGCCLAQDTDQMNL